MVQVTRGHHGNLYGLAVHPTRPDVFATAGTLHKTSQANYSTLGSKYTQFMLELVVE